MATSNTVTMVVNENLPASVSIAAVPSGAICAGTSVTFTAMPTNGGTPTYVWKKGGVIIPSATGSTYTSSALADGNQITVEMTSTATCATGSPATSNTVTMVVNTAVAASVSIIVSQNNVNVGTPVTFTANPVGGGTTPAYQWFKNTIEVASGATYTYIPVNGDVVYAVMTSSLECVTGSPATSNSITMVVNPVVVASVSINASANNVCAGTPVTFTAIPVNGGSSSTYVWYLNNVAVASGAGGTYAPTNGDVIYVVMTSNLPSVTGSPATSNSITMVVNHAPVGTVSISASANNVSPGTPVTFTATSTGGGTSPTYVWYLNNVARATGASGTYVPTNGDVVYAKMTPDLPCSANSIATSNTITMVVNQNVASVSISASANNICAGTPVTFTAIPVNGGTSPTYKWYLNNVFVTTGPGGTFIPANGDKIYCVMTSSLPIVTGSPATSNVITMAVNVPAGQPGPFTEGLAYVVGGQTNVRYTVPLVAGYNYTWSYSGTGATITGTSNSVLISFSNIATSGTLSVRKYNSCGTGEPRSGYITVGTTLKAGIISDVLDPVKADATPPKIDLKVYPNPASGPVTFDFRVSVDAKVTLDIFSISGQRIARIFDADIDADVMQSVIFNEPHPSGLYVYVLKWNDQVVTGKLIRKK